MSVQPDWDPSGPPPEAHLRVPLPAAVIGVIVRRGESTQDPIERAWMAVLLLMVRKSDVNLVSIVL